MVTSRSPPRRKRVQGHLTVSHDNGNGNGNGNGYAWPQRYSTILQTITVVALFISGFYVAIIGPIEERLGELDRGKLSEIESKIIREDWNRRAEEDRTAILKLQDAQVPRNEHEQHWKTEADRTEDLHQQILGMQKEFHDVFNAGDALKDLQRELEDLRAQVHRDTTALPGTVPPFTH